ncbi:plasma protease C1 inhibitor [Hippoglossus hippoglossus]|uniref:plasma protease C1 inhibitor n=1 Tax=Hippoglossus hippoglossus TaxID=8267 RepID=UPI00148DD6AA|nr:plasma protease C1 inhibitor [Hippoglossus hippoglossus]XP_034469811.1 plasma protease C1 inhibitor [Hippoglossus hippoglossus]
MRLQASLFVLLLLIFELSSCTQLQVTHGSSLELSCVMFQSDITGAAITWKFQGKDVNPESIGTVRVVKDGRYLSISPVTSANEGEYVCSVKENNVEIISSFNITVSASFDYTIKVFQGSVLRLPCNFPPSNQVSANAFWFRKTDDGKKMSLNLEDDSWDDNQRFNLLFPFDHDQTLLIRDTVMEDAGLYHCESAAGQKLSTVFVIVEDAPAPVPFHCKDVNTAWEPCQDESSRTGEPILQESLAEFSMKLYSYLRQSYPSSNLLFSPISISGMFSHLLLGAKNDTRKAIERAVCVPHDFHCFHFHMKKLREKLSGSLQMASQIYYNPKMNLTESFTNQSIQFYDAKPTRLLNTTEENTQMINSWVANKTNNKITQLVDSISPSTQLILLNAVSFSGQWKVKFGEGPPKGLFTKLNGDLVNVPLLYHKGYMTAMKYVLGLKAQVARFALTGDSSLYILLPRSNKVGDLQQLEDRMTDTAVLRMIEELKTTTPQPVEVSLPQIKLDVQPDMNIVMKKLGLSSLFEEANLCGLYSEDRVVLDDARHRAFLALTKEGVEAGAATAMSFARSFPSFSALQPFVMLLWSDQANVPLFIGRVTEP